MSDSVRPHRQQPTRLPRPWDSAGRTLEWVASFFSNAWKWKVKVESFSCVWLLVTPWTAAYQAPPSMGFSRQEYWSGLPLPSLEIPAELFKSLKDGAIKVLHLLFQQIWKSQQWPQDWKRSILIPLPKKVSTKECANHWTTAFIAHARKSMFKILHAWLQQTFARL